MSTVDPRDVIHIKVVRSHDSINYEIYPSDSSWYLLKQIGEESLLDKLMFDKPHRYFKATIKDDVLQILTKVNCDQNLGF